MQDFVRFERLKKVAENLWNSAKSKFVSDVVYDDATKKIKVTKNGVDTEIGVVTRWQDLQYVNENTLVNILEYSKLDKTKSIDNGKLKQDTSPDWGVIEFYPKPNVEYTLLIAKGGRVKIMSVDANGTTLQYENNPTVLRDGWERYAFTPPAGTVKSYVEIHSSFNDRMSQTMVIEGNHTTGAINFIPFSDNKTIVVGKEVSVGFNNEGTNIKSSTLEGAVKELSSRTGDDFVSKTKENVISSKTVVLDGYVNGQLYHLNNPTSNEIMGNNAIYTSKDMRIPVNTRLSTVVIGVADRFNVGDTITSIKIGIAKPTGEIQQYLIENGTAKVHVAPQGLGCAKAITIEVNQSWTDEDKTLIVGGDGLRWGGRSSNSIGGNTYAGEYQPVGATLSYTNHPGGRWNGILMMYGEDISITSFIENARSKMTELENNKVGVDASGKISTSVIPDIVLNDFHSVASQDEAMNMITAGTLRNGDVVIVQNTNNSLHMYNGTTGGNFSNSFNSITVTSGGANSVNGIHHVNGNITLDANNINALMGGHNKSIQSHLVDLSTRASNNSSAITSSNNRITALERNRHRHTIGEMVTAFNKPSNLGSHGEFTVDGAVYIYCGTPTPYTLISSSTYPELARALGKGSVATFYVPHVPDIQHQPTNSTRYHFICAKVS